VVPNLFDTTDHLKNFDASRTTSILDLIFLISKNHFISHILEFRLRMDEQKTMKFLTAGL